MSPFPSADPAETYAVSDGACGAKSGAAPISTHAQHPADLQRVIDAWPRMPAGIKAAMLALAATCQPPQPADAAPNPTGEVCAIDGRAGLSDDGSGQRARNGQQGGAQ